MVQTCKKCLRVNPAEALYCYHDGHDLEGNGVTRGPLPSGTQPFRNDFVFPSGRICKNFDQFALACHERWTEALSLLQQGYLEHFFSGLGRLDLAQSARTTAQSPDPDRGLDEFLGKLPTQVLEGPRLRVTPRQVNLGQLRVGEDLQLKLHLVNDGMRLLQGSICCSNCFWITLGDAPGQQQKLFVTRSEVIIPLRVRGKHLRAGVQPLEGLLVIESNGGSFTMVVRAEVPVTPFPQGVLGGAATPRQLAQKARKVPKEAAALFENDTVKSWYQLNGWVYPIQGPTASGLGAVQQFFEALGLTTPPKVVLSESSVGFLGRAGDQLEHELRVKTQENRPVYAYATSDQWWLQIGRPRLAGRTAVIPLVVPRVPHRPGEVLHAQVLVTANGNQRFTLPVMLSVDIRAESIPDVLEVSEESIPDVLEVSEVELEVDSRRA